MTALVRISSNCKQALVIEDVTYGLHNKGSVENKSLVMSLKRLDVKTN
jgi:hypothetical protein